MKLKDLFSVTSAFTALGLCWPASTFAHDQSNPPQSKFTLISFGWSISQAWPAEIDGAPFFIDNKGRMIFQEANDLSFDLLAPDGQIVRNFQQPASYFQLSTNIWDDKGFICDFLGNATFYNATSGATISHGNVIDGLIFAPQRFSAFAGPNQNIVLSGDGTNGGYHIGILDATSNYYQPWENFASPLRNNYFNVLLGGNAQQWTSPLYTNDGRTVLSQVAVSQYPDFALGGNIIGDSSNLSVTFKLNYLPDSGTYTYNGAILGNPGINKSGYQTTVGYMSIDRSNVLNPIVRDVECRFMRPDGSFTPYVSNVYFGGLGDNGVAITQIFDPVNQSSWYSPYVVANVANDPTRIVNVNDLILPSRNKNKTVDQIISISPDGSKMCGIGHDNATGQEFYVVITPGFKITPITTSRLQTKSAEISAQNMPLRRYGHSLKPDKSGIVRIERLPQRLKAGRRAQNQYMPH